MKVVITDAAWSDLIDILGQISLDRPAAAERLVDALHERCRTLSENALAFPIVEGYEHAGIRRRVHGNYLIFYRCRDEVVEVLHILHGARDYEKLL
ncbi:type II toxin-antitoxin system RelE/ParE family toxin [Aliihoeflea aestuarii]|jgi:toxin ParE1/3/4|uniref:type II toxin-antitoxin system RelE/ParE family toxin n=1 Tax=Aliihoeflea aestuarii TaxID=453840 RepID=UPI0020927A66|nr:type II toxin-antitoxin system RelE/ParE family toxin [Aliihoeflea aestuarii]MCO6391948.1 type II toxin-antitoxin system RelE/ParE family toxin [Aliihoeflea aestuarii]